MDKFPIKASEAAGLSCLKVGPPLTHFLQIITSRNIGLGGGKSAVGVLAHSVDIGNHYPFVGINIETAKPPIDIIRVVVI